MNCISCGNISKHLLRNYLVKVLVPIICHKNVDQFALYHYVKVLMIMVLTVILFLVSDLFSIRFFKLMLDIHLKRNVAIVKFKSRQTNKIKYV